MKIIKLQAENFKRLKAVSIDPQGNVIQVSGANEQGKSSVLDAIFAGIDMAGMSKGTGTQKALRDGEEKGFIRIDLGDMIVTRRFDSEKSAVTVESADGAKFGTPQKILDGLISKIAIDPISFSSMDEKKQRETLLKIININIDLDNLTSYRKGAFDRRTELNREIKLLESQIVGIDDIPKDTPDEEVSQVSIIEEISKAQEKIAYNSGIRISISESEKRLKYIRAKILDLENSLAESKIDLEKEGVKRSELETIASVMVDPDISPLKEKLSGIESVNKNVRIKKQISEVSKKIDWLRSQVIVQESKIAAIDKEKDDALNSAKFPVEGLSISDEGVTYNGIPFLQCSSAERLRVSVAIAIAMNPKLRVIRITDGSLIDSKNMAIIQEMAQQSDFQVWIEKVDESGKIGIYIEDGEVKAINQ